MRWIWLVAALVMLAAPAQAQTAKEVAQDMSNEQKRAWAFGVTDMAAHLFRRTGNAPRADCIVKWQAEAGFIGVVGAAMEANPTRQASVVIEALIGRRCGAHK